MHATEAPKNLLAHRLATAGIRKVAIIDDAFDPPTPGGLLQDDIDAFRQQLRADDATAEKLQEIDPGLTVDTELTAGLLRVLWDSRDRADRLGELIRELFNNKIQQLAEVTQFKPFLEELGLEVVALGKNDPIENAGEIQIAFLDYYLGEPDDQSSVTDSSKKAEAIAMKQAIVVLMSSKDTVHEGDAESFRDKSGLIRGLFRFVPKKNLGDRSSLQSHLATFSLDIGHRFVVQKFVRDVETALKAACTDATKRVRAIEFEDYGFVQRLSLRTEGQPLGEYMYWLVDAMVSQIIRQQTGLRDSIAALDKLSFEGNLLTPGEGPTRYLAEFYTAAVCEQPIEELGAHPLAGQEGVPAEALFVQFGDLFIDEAGERTVVVLTAACDLMFSGARPYRAEQTILLLPGALEQVDRPLVGGDSIFVTELFIYKNDIRRIAWDADKAEQIQRSGFDKWLKDRGLKRVGRLRPEFAYDLQHRYAARITRIGLPVAPPLSDVGDVDVVAHDGSVVNTIASGALFATAEKKRRCYFTTHAVDSLVTHLTATSQIEGEGDIATRRSKASSILAGAEWMVLLQGVPVASKPKYAQANDALTAIGVAFGADPPAPAKQFICSLRIRTAAAAADVEEKVDEKIEKIEEKE